MVCSNRISRERGAVSVLPTQTKHDTTVHSPFGKVHVSGWDKSYEFSVGDVIRTLRVYPKSVQRGVDLEHTHQRARKCREKVSVCLFLPRRRTRKNREGPTALLFSAVLQFPAILIGIFSVSSFPF